MARQEKNWPDRQIDRIGQCLASLLDRPCSGGEP